MKLETEIYKYNEILRYGVGQIVKNVENTTLKKR